MAREEVMVQTVTRRRQYQSCQHNDPLLLDQPVVLYSIILAMMMMMKLMVIMVMVREGFKNPRHGNFPLGGYPPPAPGASTDEIFPKS